MISIFQGVRITFEQTFKTTIKSEHMNLRQATHAVFTVGVACLFLYGERWKTKMDLQYATTTTGEVLSARESFENPELVLKHMTADFILQPNGHAYFISDSTSDTQLNAMKEHLDSRGWWYEVT